MSEDRICPECGEPLPPERATQARYCSNRCQARAGMRRFRERGNTSGTTRECAWCGEEFLATQEYSTFKRKYCSPRCTGGAQRAKAAESYPPREEVVRLYWDEGLSDVELGRHFGHTHQWAFKVRAHYRIPPHKTSYKARKPLHRSRDRKRWGIHLKQELVCRNCGMPPGPNGALNLHHAIPRSMYLGGRYELRNGLPLCAYCHRGWHSRTVTVYRDAFTQDEWKWISSVQLQGQNMEAWLEDRYPPRPTQGRGWLYEQPKTAA